MDSELPLAKESIPPIKRSRHDELADSTKLEPSIVVHVRNLNPKAMEADLIDALGTFGFIAYVTVVPALKMALVEFEEIEAARACVTFAATNFIPVAGDVAMFNYSTSQHIQRLGFESRTPCKVLVLTVYNVQRPLDVHVISRVCEPHAKVLRIAIVRKSLMQALVEFESAESAKKVKHAINGADIYSGCCTLKVEFAKPDHVKVTRQDANQWDFTLSGAGKGGALRSLPSTHQGGYGDAEPSAHYPPVEGNGRVLMIYGIDREKLNCEKLYNLLCQYGNVLRIRFMASKKDTAIVELGTPTAAGNAIKYLQGITLFGLTLQLKPSIQSAVRDVVDPFDLPDGSPSFRDYSMSGLHRFSTPDEAARNRLVYPTKMLHWYNAPASMDEEKIKQVFAERGAPELKSVTVFVGRSEKSSSGIVELESIEKANEALALVNHTPVVSKVGKVFTSGKCIHGKDFFESDAD
ncbi:unnamed protein product [Haemonchus placei]|uniref:RRM domain-containing protein n=1 Tax=Haemonchus placei TaxID=6290 RepID=A0A0N4X418_HAEPC|nr:unnamed protein product [Haemonchus placei]